MMGRIGLAGKDRFVRACGDVLGAQMSQIRPKACLALGRGPIRVLRRWIGEARWEQFTDFVRLDAVGGVVLRDVIFGGVSTTRSESFIPALAPTRVTNGGAAFAG
jgi:hypothetical protein